MGGWPRLRARNQRESTAADAVAIQPRELFAREGPVQRPAAEVLPARYFARVGGHGRAAAKVEEEEEDVVRFMMFITEA